MKGSNILSGLFAVAFCCAQAHALPYTLPTAGNAALIGSNYAQDVRPAPHSAANWQYATMDIYGAGAFVGDYSSGGAYVVAGSGGHQGPAMYGALIFDFETAAWSYVHNANNMPNQVASCTAAQMNSVNEISIAGVTGNMPAPAHIYRYAVGLSPADGGGSKGSFLLTTGAGADESGGRGLTYAYKFDLVTGFWSRATSNRRSDAYSGYGYFLEGCAAFDPVAKRVYVTPGQLEGLSALPYVDLASGSWKAASRGGVDPTSQQHRTSFVDSARRLIVFKSSTGLLWAFDLNNIAAGPVKLTVSGTLPGHDNKWDYYPVDGCWYTYKGTGQTIDKLIPPTGVTGTGGTWSSTSVSIAGATLPAWVNPGNGSIHYTRFFYVPALQCFAWISGVSTKVALIKPPGSTDISNSPNFSPPGPALTASPNPANKTVNVQVSDNRVGKMADFELFNSSGQAVKFGRGGAMTWDISTFPAGVYILRVRTFGGMLTQKILVSR